MKKKKKKKTIFSDTISKKNYLCNTETKEVIESDRETIQHSGQLEEKDEKEIRSILRTVKSFSLLKNNKKKTNKDTIPV